MATTCLTPGIDLRRERIDAAPARDHAVRAEVVDRPAEAVDAIAQLSPSVDDLNGVAEENEPVREPSGSVECGFPGSTEPDRDGSLRTRYEGGSFDPVKAACERDDRFREQTPQQLDLLLLPCATSAEVLAESVVLDVVPANAQPETESPAGEEIDIGRLSCHERGLALRNDQDPGRETDSLGDAREIAEHHKRVVERVTLGVRTRERRCSIGVYGSEYVVVGEEMVIAQVFDCCPKSTNRVGIASKLDLRVDDADAHAPSAFQTTRGSPTREVTADLLKVIGRICWSSGP